ncbi:MAG: hypothetical protein Q7J57_01080 [Gemmobacter sp.]|nr:hypothetical protein [Gemmobacter sp.]
MSLHHIPETPSVPAAMARALEHALDAEPRRVQAVKVSGQVVWVKQAEQLSLRWRLQKGDTRRAFEADRAGLHVLGEAGLPVPPILAEGPDFFVVPDVGKTLAALLLDPQEAGPARMAAFVAAGQALANLHKARVCHGRPSIRDICWDGTTARMIDFERFVPGPRAMRDMALDVIVFHYSILTYGRGETSELAAAAAAYRAAAPEGVWQAARARVARLRWLAPVARLAQRIKPRSWELRAVPMVITFFARPRGAA